MVPLLGLLDDAMAKELKILARIHRRLLDLKMNSQIVAQEDNIPEQIETVQSDIPQDFLK